MANVDVEIDASDLDKAQKSLLQLAKNLQADSSELQQNEPRKMKENILTSIRKNFEDTHTDSNSTSLLDAFYITSGPYGKQITTRGMGADHALALEEGISQHIIEGDPWLAFQPDNISNYPERLRAGGGYVVTDSVLWRPDLNGKQETATGYEYVYEAQVAWESSILRSLPRKIRESIRQAKYKQKP